MKNYQRLKGLIAATFTPMDEKGNLNLTVIDQYAELMIRSGLKGVFLCGTTGESASLTIEEQKEIAEAWIKSVKGKLKVIIQVGCNAQQQAIDLAKHAYAIGADGIAATAPYFFKPRNVTELVDFFVPIATSAKELPFYYYNIPSMTGVYLPVPEFLTEGKIRIPNLAGVKYTHINLMEMAQCIHMDNGAFEVFNGYDEILLPGLSLGAKAAVGSAFNYFPAVYYGIIDAFDKGDFVKARELQIKSIEVVNIITKHGGSVRGGKAIMNLLGIECGPCRLPLAPFSEEEYIQLKEDLDKVGFFSTVAAL